MTPTTGIQSNLVGTFTRDNPNGLHLTPLRLSQVLILSYQLLDTDPRVIRIEDLAASSLGTQAQGDRQRRVSHCHTTPSSCKDTTYETIS